MRCRRVLILTSSLAVAAVSLLAAGCGSNSSSTSSSSGSGGPQSQAQIQEENQELVRFADCMRSHGVSDFPDPTNPHAFKQAMDPTTEQSPAFGSAMTACQHLLPGGGSHSQTTPPTPAQTAALLAFARCLRSHGFPRFPDPDSTGNVTHQMIAAAGINLQQPAVLRAGDTCTSVTHGRLTPAEVARFVAGH